MKKVPCSAALVYTTLSDFLATGGLALIRSDLDIALRFRSVPCSPKTRTTRASAGAGHAFLPILSSGTLFAGKKRIEKNVTVPPENVIPRWASTGTNSARARR